MRGNSVFAFPSLHSPVTTPKTGTLHILTVCRGSFCLFRWVFFVVFFNTPPFTLVYSSGGCFVAQKTTILSQLTLFDDLHYILFAGKYSGLRCCVHINYSVRESDKRERRPCCDENESVYRCRGRTASRRLCVV